ncbi:uncharacterized protein LOC115051843 [Echeneis naucrates]|uniref:uncharacterized protein LOC115051843 n=1 Tax=Echeneis naucrates TaxID=173247 RepID=UPI001113C9C3|nr:uncharacterized protein LOC115051843 [Echeneis naucrates]
MLLYCGQAGYFVSSCPLRPAKEEQEHIHDIQTVLQCLENSLFVKVDKCKFHNSSVSFLGYIIDQNCIEMDPAKASAIASWTIHDSCKQLQCFLEFANFYRRFLQGYSAAAAPLTAITSPKAPFRWCQATEEVFQHLSGWFRSASYPTAPRQLVVEVDTSDVGMGAVLSQCSAKRPEAAHLRLLLQAFVPGGEEI